MKYPPGSFTKNFAWHGTGLRKLHTSIGAGFAGKLVAVDRQKWRKDSGIKDASLELIPLNFFLHNKNGKISVDELVLQAVQYPHSQRFDRLALFALHLTRAGSGKGVIARPAMWANGFVREKLWSNGIWEAKALQDTPLDSFIDQRMEAKSEGRIKCRNNYRHLFELCDYWPTKLPEINSGAEQWIAAALFLAWDRYILDGGNSDKAQLLKLVSQDELHKLLGVSFDYAADRAKLLVELYADVGNINRFSKVAVAKVVATSKIIAAGHKSKLAAGDGGSSTTVSSSTPELTEEEQLAWLDQDSSDEVVERKSIQRDLLKRNRRKAAALKLVYENKCMFCSIKLQIAEDRFYSEAAHIKPLGKPHNGPDKIGNMLVLCPNHHLQYDWGHLRLQKVSSGYQILSSNKGDPLHGMALSPKHKLDDACISWHFDWFKPRKKS